MILLFKNRLILVNILMDLKFCFLYNIYVILYYVIWSDQFNLQSIITII